MPISTNLTSLEPAADRLKKSIKLLSCGYSVKNICPGGEIDVYPWDSEVSAFMQARLKAGTSSLRTLFEVFGRVTRLKAEQVDLFVASEVTSILLFSRALAYDSFISYDAECPACHHTSSEKIEIPRELEKVGEKKPDYAGYDDFTLPLAKDVIRLRPLLVQDELAIENNKTLSELMVRLSAGIISVNGGKPDSAQELATYLLAVHPLDIEWLAARQQEQEPSLNPEIKHKCDKCGTAFSKVLTLNTDFFRSTRS